jgi:sensor histidine kinase YesM
MIQSLGYMLESNLHSGDKNIYSLREEIEYISHYARIIKYKYADKIDIQFCIPDDLLNCKIPKSLIQPFVENSVRHGLVKKNIPGRILLTIEKKENELIITIVDDGVGIRPDILRVILQENPMISDCDQGFHHIGLINIRKRIRILYGKKYGFTIKSHLYKGTVATIRIPCEYN